MQVDLKSIQNSLTPAEQDLLNRYTLNVHKYPELHSQESVPVSLTTLGYQTGSMGGGDDDDGVYDDDDRPILAADLQPQRHSVAVVDGYDSPSSPDEIVLSTMAKV